MSATKQRILDAALNRFNLDGMVNVRLQHIADEANMSVGNLAYHFPNKEAILTTLYEKLTEKQNELLTEYRVVPLFDNIDRLISHTFQLQQAFIFFYFDTLEIVRAYPSVGQTHQRYIASQIEQLKVIIDFNVSRGALVEEPLPEVYDQLAAQMWMTMDFWFTQQSVKTGEKCEEKMYKRAVWNLLIPYFTDMGKLEYNQMLQMPYDFFF
jgi:AcrR family transcriptional regulator